MSRVSAATGEPLRPRWSMAGSPSTPGGPVATFSSMSPHADTGEYRLSVPVGEVVVRVEAFQSGGLPYAGAEARLSAVAGQGAQTVAVGPGQGLRVRYRCDGAPVPAQHVEAELEALAGEGERSSSDWGDDHLLYFVSEPGAYTVTVDPPNGYRAPEPIVVDLPAGEIVERTIELELER